MPTPMGHSVSAFSSIFSIFVFFKFSCSLLWYTPKPQFNRLEGENVVPFKPIFLITTANSNNYVTRVCEHGAISFAC